MAEEEQVLSNQNDYLSAGIHIGTKMKSPGMKRFIYKVRNDGLYRLDIKTIDNRLKIAAKMIARYNHDEIVITASRLYAISAAERFADIIKAKFIKGRVTPGVFTNPHREDFMEPKVIIISDSRNEKQAVKEASKVNMPIVAISDTDNSTKFVDLIIPANNRGRKALAYIYFILSREVLKARGEIASDQEFKYSPQDFEASLGEKPQSSGEAKQDPRHQREEEQAHFHSKEQHSEAVAQQQPAPAA
jgi:small subunit ribosomal protein S2